MQYVYIEDQFIEQPAIGLLMDLGWGLAGRHPNASGAGEPRDAGLVVRETKGEVVQVSWLCAASERLKCVLPPEDITAAADESTLVHSAMPYSTSRVVVASAVQIE